MEMDRHDNRARGDRLLSPRVTFNPGSEPRGSSFGYVLLPDASRAYKAKVVGTGVEFRHRIGRTAATDDRPHELREQGQMASGARAPAELGLRLGLSEGAMTALRSMLPQEGKFRIAWLNYRWDGARQKSRFSPSG